MILIAPYILLFFVFFLMAQFDIWSIKLNKNSQQGMYFFSLALMVFFAGCRWFNVPLNPEPGVWQIFDYTSYEYTYDNALPLSNFISNYVNAEPFIKSMDIGYVFVSSFFSLYIFSDANCFFLMVSFVTITILAFGFKRNHIKNSLFVILFIFLTRLYFQYNFIMIRQAISMVVVWWAMPYITQQKFWKFFFFCILGGLFHFTALLFVISYFFPKINFSNKFLMCIIPIFLILSVSGLADKIFLMAIEQGLMYVGLGEKGAAYIGNGIYKNGINPLNFLEMMPFLYFALKHRIDMCQTPEGKLFFNMTVFYVLFMIITMNFLFLVRFSSYYIYAFFYVINVAYSKVKIYENRVIYGYAFMLYFFLYGVRFINANFYSTGYNLFFLN